MFLKKVNNCIKVISFILLFNIFFSSIFASESKEFVKVNVPSAVVMDAKTGRVLFEKNANERRPMASLTKIMTSILLVENCKMDELIEVPKEATWIGGSEVGLKKGDKVTARSLLYGMMLPSR